MDISTELMKLADEKNKEFIIKLTPGLNPDRVLGARIPNLRKLAKKLVKLNEYQDFLNEDHRFFEEFNLHGLIISEIKNFDEVISNLYVFLPEIDNWASCDIISPKVFKKNRDLLLPHIRRWMASEHEYTLRFGVEMLMTHFLDEDFKPEYLDWAASVKKDTYYVNMMLAWFFATALCKQYECAVKYIERRLLERTVHAMTIRKAVESLRISDEKKTYLRTLK